MAINDLYAGLWKWQIGIKINAGEAVLMDGINEAC